MPLRERATAETGTGEVHQIAQDTSKLLDERRRDASGERDSRAGRDALVTSHLALAHSLARQFADRGETLDDLRQVAAFGLIKAADRFDPERGVQFSTFATATIVGELKRHFRDSRWGLRVTRSWQERYLAVREATERLTAQLGRAPAIVEVAQDTGIAPEDVIEAYEAGRALNVESLDAPMRGAGSDDDDHVADVAEFDLGFVAAEARAYVSEALATIRPREREILRLRFAERRTQAEIGERLGISQMQVSRLLQRTLGELRQMLNESDAP